MVRAARSVPGRNSTDATVGSVDFQRGVTVTVASSSYQCSLPKSDARLQEATIAAVAACKLRRTTPASFGSATSVAARHTSSSVAMRSSSLRCEQLQMRFQNFRAVPLLPLLRSWPDGSIPQMRPGLRPQGPGRPREFGFNCSVGGAFARSCGNLAFGMCHGCSGS